MRALNLVTLTLMTIVVLAFAGPPARADGVADLKPIVTGDPDFDAEIRRLHQATVAAERGLGPAPDYDALFRGRHQPLFERARKGRSQGEIFLGLMKLAVLSPAWSGYPTRYQALREPVRVKVAEVTKRALEQSAGKPERSFHAFAAMTPAIFAGDYNLALNLRDELLGTKNVWIPSASDGFRIAVLRNFQGAGRVAIKLKLHDLEKPGAEACLAGSISDALAREIAVLLGEIRRTPNTETFRCLKAWPKTARRKAGLVAIFARSDNAVYRPLAREIIDVAKITKEDIASHARSVLRRDDPDSRFSRMHDEACIAASNLKDEMTCLSTFDGFLRHGGMRRQITLRGLRLLAERGLRKETAERILPIVREQGSRAIIQYRHVLRACGPEVAELAPEIMTLIRGALDKGMPPDLYVIRELRDIVGAMGEEALPLLLKAREDKAFRPVVASALERMGGAAIPAVQAIQSNQLEPALELAGMVDRILEEAEPRTYSSTAIAAVTSLCSTGPKSRRRLAIDALGRIGERAGTAAPTLVRLAEQGELKLPALCALHEVKLGSWRRLYLKALQSEQPGAAVTAIRSIGSQPERADLLAVVKRVNRSDPPDPELEGAVMDTLKRLGPAAKPALPVVRRALESEDAGRILDALSVLSGIDGGGVELAPTVLRRLEHSNARIRVEAAGLLPHYGDAARPAIPLLVPRAVESDNTALYCRLLAGFGRPAVDAVFAAYKEHPKDFGRTPQAELSKAEEDEIFAVRKHNHRLSMVLYEVAGDQLGYAFKAIESENPHRRALTIMLYEYLARNGGLSAGAVPKIYARVAGRIKDESPCVRETAVLALSGFQGMGKKAAEQLAGVLADGTPSLTYAALLTLESMGQDAKHAVNAIRLIIATPPTPLHADLARQILKELGVDETPGVEADPESPE